MFIDTSMLYRSVTDNEMERFVNIELLPVIVSMLTEANRIGGDVKVISDDYNVQISDSILLCDDSAEREISLYSAADASFYIITFKKTGDESNDININAATGETIDGSSSITLPRFHGSRTLVSDGSNWHIIYT